MASISQLSMSLVSMIRYKSSQVQSKIISLENSNKQKDFELARVKFQIEETANELGSSKQNLRKTIEELQNIKKEVVDTRILNQTGNSRADIELDLARTYIRVELENKQLIEYNWKINDELLQTQEKLMTKDSDYLPANTPYAIVRKMEAEVVSMVIQMYNGSKDTCGSFTRFL